MKKHIFFITILLLLLGLAGCSEKEKALNAEELTASTLLAKSNGVIQVGTLETFDEPYYDLTELKNFITKEIAAHNQRAGKDKITFDNIIKQGNNAIMVLTYAGMDQYTTFNKVKAAYFSGGVSEVLLELPATLVNAKNEALASTQEILQNKDYKILVLYEPYNIIVDGKVKFYSENVKPISSNEVSGASEGMTVVVFK